MSYDGGISVKINNSKLKAMLVEAERDGLFIEYFTENEKYDFSFENEDDATVYGCPKDLDDLKDYILQLIEFFQDGKRYREAYCRFEKVFEAEYPNLKDSFTYVSWNYSPGDETRAFEHQDDMEFKFGKPGRKKVSNKKKNGPSTLKEIFPGIDMTKPSGLVVDDDGCCTGYDRKQHAEFLGEEKCLFITKDVRIIEDEDEEIFDLLTMYDKCVVTSDLEDFGEYYNCGGFSLFYIIDAETNKVVYSSEKDEFCSDTYGLSLSLSLEEEENDHFNEVLGKYTKCDDINNSGETEEEFDEEDLEKSLEGKTTDKKSSTTSAKTAVSKPKADYDETEEITITYDKCKVKVTVKVEGDDRILAGESLFSYPFLKKTAARDWKIVEEKMVADALRTFENSEVRLVSVKDYLHSAKSLWEYLSKHKGTAATQEDAKYISEVKEKPGYLKDDNGFMRSTEKLLAEIKKCGFSYEDTIGALLNYWNSFASMDLSVFTSVLETYPRKKDGLLMTGRIAVLPISSPWIIGKDTGRSSKHTISFKYLREDSSINIYETYDYYI